MFNGKNSKESFQYYMECYALKEEIREVLSIQEYYTLEIQNIFRYPYYGTNMKRNAHMVGEVCNEVGTRRLPPGAKRGGKKEDSSKPYACPSSKRMFGFLSNKTSSDHQDEEASSSLKKKRNEAITGIHEVK